MTAAPGWCILPAYRPRSGGVELLWPGQRWAQTLSDFAQGERTIVYA